MYAPSVTVAVIVSLSLSLSLLLLFISPLVTATNVTATLLSHRPLRVVSLCGQLIIPSGYDCSEHTVETKDGFLLALQRVSSPLAKLGLRQRGPPVLLQHGLFMAGDAWFLNSNEQSLGFILADRGFDVWIGNVRGTRWSHGHISLSTRTKAFWDWSWEELALYDLAAMIEYIYQTANSKIFLVGHSQGTIMSFAAFTQPDIVNMVEAAALLCPISYLNHVSAPFVLRMVNMYLDKMILAMGIHQLNFHSVIGAQILESVCYGRLDCNDLLASITGANCCFNTSRIDFYLDYEPHPSSAKNLNHLFQMIRQGTFAKYDYGLLKNLRLYSSAKPPVFDLSLIPESLPLWMAYGGNDELADVTDVKRTLKELPCKHQSLYLDHYGHVDFLLSVNAKEDVYEPMIEFFNSLGKSSSFK